MNRSAFYLLAFILAASCSRPPEFDPTEYVDPQIGSVHGRWFFYTPAALPFGMAKLAPHTNAYNSPGAWMPCGYDDRHTSIEGFGHFHEFQVGGLVTMPTVGAIKTVPGTLEDPDSGYRSRFEKERETAEAGYYSVLLKDYGIFSELTATKRVGYHRYTFPKSDRSNILFDLGHKQGESSGVEDASARWIGGKEIEGTIVTYPEYLKFCDPDKRVKMYFVGRLSKEPVEIGAFTDTGVKKGASKTEGINNGLYATFRTNEGEVIEMQVGLSFTSIENARLNLDAETNENDFDKVRKQAHLTWKKMLGRIKVEGKNEKDKLKFYTGLYHALLGRGISSDVNGAFPTRTGEIGQIPLDEHGKPEHVHVNTDGFWGGFWNLSQLWALAYPEVLSNYVQSNIDFYKYAGWLHDGEAAGTHANGVQTNFQALLMASAYNCGIRDFDVALGYEAALKNELEYHHRDFGSGKYDLSYFVKMGYIPSQDTVLSNGWVFNFGGSHTLEYAFSSFAVAQFAKALGNEGDYDKLMKQAAYYKNLFDPETKFIRPKLPNGEFIDDFDPMEPWRGFQEGNGFQYTWYVPHDIAGLMHLVGKDLFNERLETQFIESQKTIFGGGEEIDSFSGLAKQYNHGNQPCLHNSWLFNYSGKPWLTQKWTRTICNEFYGTEPLHGYGYGQDEDQGQLGAWYVMTAMGLFDVQGHASARPTFQLGSPLFDRITIDLNKEYYDQDRLIIEVENNSAANSYVQSVQLNGKPLHNSWFYRDELLKGGKLNIKMGLEPNKQWGIDTPPPSMSTN
ncbi:MAG: GH92 family glycosyl hydrolase [Cytophagales bacterium]|nr:GH92 family glycosyl hydrolase [Cytophagales bacterium]